VRIEAAIVNHDTSPFAELALRSLTTCATQGADLAVTVLDNHSDDEGLDGLRSAVTELGATFELTRWPRAATVTNSHGDALRDFVLGHESADAFLLVDADVVWTDPTSVRTMVDELGADEDRWAVQARFHWAERHRGPGASRGIWAGRPIRMQFGSVFDDREPALGPTLAGTIRPRCHPAATLVANTSVFRGVAARLGLGTGAVFSNDVEVAGFHDTLGLASHAMEAYGKRSHLSSAVVIHYFNVSYERPELVVEKLGDCRARLARLRADPSSPALPGPWGPWGHGPTRD
jgi:hypothetical protein